MIRYTMKINKKTGTKDFLKKWSHICNQITFAVEMLTRMFG